MRLGAVGAPLVLGALIAYMGTLVAAYRYFFPYFMGDNGWYLQVAWRVAQGAALYRDVLWAYGPLPIQVLAGLFRWVAAEAWLANLLSGLFAMLACLLSYFVMRTLVSRRAALVISAFTVLVGPFVLGDLTRAYLFAYTQPIVWGALFSLAALAAALAWQQAPHPLALVGTGILCGIALLSKPEYGLAAVGSVAVVLLRERAGRGAWVGWGLGVALCVLGDGAWVAREAGWAALVRGYRGYDQLASRALWGTRPGLTTPLTWFVGMHALWASGLALLLGKRRAALRPWAYAVALGAALLGAALVLLFIFPDGARQTLATLLARRWGAVHVDFSRLLPLLVALPWGPLLALLLLVGWLAWRMPEVPVAFWGIWSLVVSDQPALGDAWLREPVCLWPCPRPAVVGGVSPSPRLAQPRRAAARASVFAPLDWPASCLLYPAGSLLHQCAAAFVRHSVRPGAGTLYRERILFLAGFYQDAQRAR